jgi:hypothetical protein
LRDLLFVVHARALSPRSGDTRAMRPSRRGRPACNTPRRGVPQGSATWR